MAERLGNGNCKETMKAHVEPKTLRAAEMSAHELEARRHLAELEVTIAARQRLCHKMGLNPQNAPASALWRIAEMEEHEEQIRDRFAELDAIAAARQRLQNQIDSDIENMHCISLLIEERTARPHFSNYFSMFTVEATSQLFGLVSNPPVLSRGGSWFDEAEYFEQLISDSKWIETIWAYLLYRTTRSELESMLQDGREAGADPHTKAAIQSWA